MGSQNGIVVEVGTGVARMLSDGSCIGSVDGSIAMAGFGDVRC